MASATPGGSEIASRACHLPRCLPARCSARPEPVNWPDLAPWPKLILTWWNGTTVNMKGGARRRYLRNAQTGNCSETAVREANRQHKWASGRTVWSSVSAQFRETYFSFPADTSFEFLPPAG